MSPSEQPKQDEFVARIVSDPKTPPDSLLLSGYIGNSSEPGHTRLYFDPQLGDYVEIPNDAILSTEAIPKEQSALGGSFVWIKRDAELVHGKVGASRFKARFLEGRIQQAYGATAAAIYGALGPVATPAAPASVYACPSQACVPTLLCTQQLTCACYVTNFCTAYATCLTCVGPECAPTPAPPCVGPGAGQVGAAAGIGWFPPGWGVTVGCGVWTFGQECHPGPNPKMAFGGITGWCTGPAICGATISLACHPATPNCPALGAAIASGPGCTAAGCGRISQVPQCLPYSAWPCQVSLPPNCPPCHLTGPLLQ